NPVGCSLGILLREIHSVSGHCVTSLSEAQLKFTYLDGGPVPVLAERRVTDQSRATPASVYDNGLFQLRFRKLLKSLARSYDEARRFQRAEFPVTTCSICYLGVPKGWSSRDEPRGALPRSSSPSSGSFTCS